MKNSLSITVISKACGVSTPTLRVWEKRYQAFSPTRNEAGQRLYSENDLQRSKLIAVLLEKGHAISSVANLSLSDLQSLLDKGGDETSSVKDKNEIKKILGLLKKYDLQELVDELQFQRQSLGAKDFVFKIVLPLMQETGLLVAKGNCSITQEHIISSIVRDQLSKISLPSNDEKLEKIAIATPEGNLHELAILMADVICKINRVPTNYLGAAHPPQCLGEAVSALKCQAIVMGVISSDQWDYEKNIVGYLIKLDQSLKTKAKVFLGGGWKLNFPKFKNITEVRILDSFEEFDNYLSQKSK